MKYTYSLSDRSLSALISGKMYQTDRSNPAWKRIKEMINDDATDDTELIELFSPVKAIVDGMEEITVRDGAIFWGDEPLHNELSRRMLDVMTEGLDIEPWRKFATNVYKNPSPWARDELYGWLEASGMPITPDGAFIAYKKVNDNFTDCYSGTIDNSVGAYVSMPRQDVDPIRDNTCSYGLHFCSKEYLRNFGGTRTVLVKINPADVVSIPSDYNNAKGRTCAYEVVGVIQNEVAYDLLWDPISAGHDGFRWGYDPEEEDDDFEPSDAVTSVTVTNEDSSEERFVMSVAWGVITPDRLSQMLADHGGKQSALARALGMSAGTVQKWVKTLLH